MNILLYSHLFYPSVGGIETIANQLAENFIKLGHQCTLVTYSTRNDNEKDDYPFAVVRRPSKGEKERLVTSADIVYSNGASVQLFWSAWRHHKPFVWTHQGYQLSCIDGLGWVNGEASPLRPLPSLLFHLKKSGISYAISGYIKLLHRRLVGRLVSKNVAVTGWVAYRQPLPGQVVMHTPYRVNKFTAIADTKDFEYDFMFVGRLVSEKGVATLLKAFEWIRKKHPSYTGKLLIIGDGSWRKEMETLSSALGIDGKVDFVGKKVGEEMLPWVAKGRIAVAPSEWEEPMGGVSLEMMAAGKPIIVSARGGMAECVGKGGMVFDNGNAEDLGTKMWELLSNEPLQAQLKQEAQIQLKKLDEEVLTMNYIDLFESLIRKK